MTKEDSKVLIAKLIAKYETIVRSDLVKKYTEEDTKKDFILPLFEALGWEVTNRSEVSAEEQISSQRVDYGFYIGGRPKFYVESKPLKADLNKEEYARQAIRYSWNKGVVWAVLTDFEGLKIFNAQDAKSSLASKLLFSISYDEYIERIDQLWLLSREVFEKNLLDEYAEKIGKKLEKIPVDVSLFRDLNQCRGILTESLGRWNKKVNKDLLDEGIQKLLDRLIFIRVAEDRGIESPTLVPLVREWNARKDKNEVPLYQSMIQKFREFDKIYDSNLFTAHAFEKWEEYDGSTEKVIKILHGKPGYYEYDFKLIPADVLGAVYENYLGYRFAQSKDTARSGKDLKKRKEQGIYYTPRFIVEYIVDNALGPVLKKCNSINELKKIRVLDPACGSGSFLIRALEVINIKYREFGYSSDETTKLMILTSHLFGVDLDPQAVELTRLNLLINALDKRGQLPDLSKNIKNGNSLISGSEEQLKKIFGERWEEKRPFNWRERFKDVFQGGGFDVIIGNPPYIKEYVDKSAFEGLHKSPYYQGKMDIWTLFACQAIDHLKEGGYFSFIAPNNWLTNAGASVFRDKILKEGEIISFIDFGNFKVFKDAGIQTMIFVFHKRKPRKEYHIKYAKVLNSETPESALVEFLISENAKSPYIESFVTDFSAGEYIGGKSIAFSSAEKRGPLEKMHQRAEFYLSKDEVAQGIVGDPDRAFIFGGDNFNVNEKNILKNYFTSTGRYVSGDQRELIAYIDKKQTTISELPKIRTQLEKYRQPLENRREVRLRKIKWFQLHWPRNEGFFKRGPKIVCGIRVRRPGFYYTEEEYYGSRALNFIKTTRINLKYLTAVFNSRVLYFWFLHEGKRLGDLLQIDKGPLLQAPIPVAPPDVQKKIAQYVEDLQRRMSEMIKLDPVLNKEVVEERKDEFDKIDSELDHLIYRLYDFTLDEIKIIETETN